MDNLFQSLFANGSATPAAFFLCLGAALLCGILFSSLCFVRSRSSKSFFVTLALLPPSVALVILLVNGNVGAGVAVAGAFSLVRFRSAPGTAREIAMIFLAMASGLAFGMGYLAYGALSLLLAGGVLLLFSCLSLWEQKPDEKEKKLTVTIPENLDYTALFDDLFSAYTEKHSLLLVKSIQMGSLFRLTYRITLKDPSREKELLDSLRERNGNLELSLERTDLEPAEL